MALRPRVHLTNRQGLSLSAHMRAAISVLRMPTATLLEDIAREAAENPFLVVDSSRRAGDVSAYDYALAIAEAPESLQDKLSQQLAMQRLDAPTEAAAAFLIGELREDGYLDVSLEELAETTGAPLGILKAGLKALHRCDPPGIGARDLAECLALQLIDTGLDEDTAHRATERLEDFAEARWAGLGHRLALPVAELERIADLLRHFPSSPVQSDDSAPIILIPEIRIDCHEDRAEARLNSTTLPGISVLQTDRASLTTDEMKALFERAAAFSDAVTARRATLLRIASAVAQKQGQFFLKGHKTVAPLTRGEIALELRLHPSTVGRAIAGKALIADGRVYAFDHFFPRALASANGGVSPFDIQRRIRAMIEREDSEAPLADGQIQTQLQHEGVDIARRTVAKYRKCLRIPSSFARRSRKLPAKGGTQVAPPPES
jgi:RNA polymerase sigma-54 factor